MCYCEVSRDTCHVITGEIAVNMHITLVCWECGDVTCL